jgi:hypothetical protein
MSNHYHLLIETREATLSRGMKYLNGTYTQSFNRHNNKVGHVLQGRYKAILVQKDSYLLELARYIVLNPVRARMVKEAKDWPWSSYRATAGFTLPEFCLTTDWILSSYGRTRKKAQQQYRTFVQQGKNQPSPWESLKNQIYLGNDDFVQDMQSKIDPEQSLNDIPTPQKQAPKKPLLYFEQCFSVRDEAMYQAYISGHYTLSEVGKWFGVSHATVSRAVKLYENM